MPLTSKTLTSDPNVKARLELCATKNDFNIHRQGRDPTGSHVTAIHAALVGLGFAIEQKELNTNSYSSSTEAAVIAFKKDGKRNGTGGMILQPWQTTPDPVVGIRTIAALDAEIKKKEGPPTPPTPPTPPSDTKVKFRDVIVAISMTPHRAAIKTADQLEQFVRSRVKSDEYDAKKDRDLTVQGVFADANAFSVSGVVTKLRAVPLAEGQQFGLVMMYGISFAGLKAIEVAKAVGGKPVIRYFGVADGAFHDPDTDNIPLPSFQKGVPSNTPMMKKEFAAFTANTKVNVYQKKGNRMGTTTHNASGLMWTSNMDGEIHGEIPNFRNDPPVEVTGDDPTEMHKQAATIGEDRMLGEMQSILRGVGA